MDIFCKRKIILVFCGIIVMIFFSLPVNAANAKTVLSPTEIIFNTPIVKTLNKFYSQNLPIKDLVLGAGVECGGGDQTKIGLGPVLENIESCDVCKNIAQCLTNKYGVSGAGVGYLWDSVTKRCGLGIEISKAEAESCQEEEDPCLGVDSARFAEIKDDVLGAVDAVKNLKNKVTFNPYFEADDVAPAELLLALTWVESKWDTLYGNTTYNSNLPFSCSDEETAMNEMCSDINFGLKTVDKHGKECEEMPIADDPDGAESICDGKMGISQILPSIYVPKTFFGGTNQCVAECGAAGGELTTCVGICQSKNLIGEVTGELYPDPWNQHDGIYMAETILTLRHANFDGPGCIADCVAQGRGLDVCLSECRAKKERCAIIDYHFGAGTCATAGAVEDAFVTEVRRYKPVMKNLLDTGTCKIVGGCMGLVNGLPADRFNELAPTAIEISQKVFDLYGYSVRPEFIMAVLATESRPNFWSTTVGSFHYTEASFPDPLEDLSLWIGPAICGDPGISNEVLGRYQGFIYDSHTVNQCTDMPLNSVGMMGMGQFNQRTWVLEVQRLTGINGVGRLNPLTGRTIANPFEERDVIAATALYLGFLVDFCGDEEKAAGFYVGEGCSAPNSHYEVDKLWLPTIEQLFAGNCGAQITDACPLLMFDMPPNPGFIRLNSDFCPVDPSKCLCYIAGRIHKGVDLSALRSQPIFAIEDGMVTNATDWCIEGDPACGGGYGNFVTLVADSGKGYLYAHLETVRMADFLGANPPGRVTKGQVLGTVDNTGRSGGDHLHFEFNASGNPYFSPPEDLEDPRDYFTCIPKACGGVWVP